VRRRSLGAQLLIILVFGAMSCQSRQAVRETDHVARIENGLLPAVVIQGQLAPPPMKLFDRMAHYHVPGVSIAVINNGQIEWAKGYGVLDATDSRAVTPETLFQAASISKPVTAMAALALVQRRRLSLDEDVNLKLRSWKVPDNEFTKGQKVTLRRLLSHTAGFNVEDVGSYARGEELPTLVEALDGVRPAHSDPIRVQTVPGSSWRYSGGGYSVVQQLLIDVTGRPFADLMQELVLGRVGMTSSTFGQPLPLDLEPVAATAHQISGDPFKGRWYTFPQAAAAGLWTTPSDLARFAIEIQRSYKGQSNAVLSVDMTKEMLTPTPGGYGLGLWVGGKERSATFSHSGKNEGFTCILFAYLETGQGAVVMTNGDGGNGLFNEVLRALAHEYGWPDYRPREKAVARDNPALYSSYAGEYDVNGVRTTVTRDHDRLYVVAPPVWSQPVRLYPSAEDQFFLLDEDVDLTFVRDTRGHVTGMRAIGGGQTVTAKKLR
jgi:CubicO group peptidase (beta-lactamase class C family)